MSPVEPENARIEIDKQPDGNGRLIRLVGRWKNNSLSAMIKSAGPLIDGAGTTSETIDLSGVTGMDTAGAWLIRRFVTEQRAQGRSVEIVGGSAGMRQLIEALPEAVTPPEKPIDRRNLFERIFEPVGRVTISLWDDMVAMMFVLGSAVRGAQTKLGRGAGVSPASVVNQLDHMGVRAVPIIVLMSFLIGAIIAQQGAFQLRYFGAEVFVVDLVGILQLREIGVLLTAIMIAGRSGSAITAEIGSMKMREEIDALKVIGLNPIGVLVFPRLVALTIALPLLTIVANFSALYGAAVVAWAYSGITFDVFITRLHEAVDYSTLATGMIKAPFMALIIGIIAAVEGMKVGGSAESLGRHVTASVVKSIFVVILVDGLFAMFYAAIDF
ncbi:phospholipid/cholesterol/gamma-HCH transport system permease protein [Peteryoungia aggregata LMG 23059]|uniref:Phospholipid/cholesterol/gamma-HCH transport system permease protein n=1 Tax=Peteryoungia aggregata LMG 23059 TaxID=1368425 RepID=A0ABU0G9N8_9HYPH|nr:MlaE family lipid ABC transporter permease subunit [Peteryoungia aggregata]MDQ0421446.1 phospholipid/cholesterol/gamma-HCH transport system permease protein [Peteryoungia aggregata LMG 23059]